MRAFHMKKRYNKLEKGGHHMIIGAYIVPHPPVILSDIGKGEEIKISKTKESYQQIAQEIASLCPETILIISPHAPAYMDYIQVSNGPGAIGDFSAFQAPDIALKVPYDQAFINELSTRFLQDEMPAGTMGKQDGELDHGTMIPLCFILEAYNEFQVVRVGVSSLNAQRHYEVGNYIREVSDHLARNVVIIASGDLSHTLKADGPYGFVEEGLIFDQEMLKIMKQGSYEKMLHIDAQAAQRAAQCGLPAFQILYGAIHSLQYTSTLCSYEDVFGVGYAIAKVHIQPTDIYVALARIALEKYIITGEKVTVEQGDAYLLKHAGAVFVSLHMYGELRGCVGTMYPQFDMIADEIISNAIHAGFRDPRFSPIQQEELPHIEYQVDVLTEPEDIDNVDMLDCKRYGIIVYNDARNGVLLPALEGVETVQDQIRIALDKAGISSTEPYHIQRFEVIRHVEGERATL